MGWLLLRFIVITGTGCHPDFRHCLMAIIFTLAKPDRALPRAASIWALDRKITGHFFPGPDARDRAGHGKVGLATLRSSPQGPLAATVAPLAAAIPVSPSPGIGREAPDSGPKKHRPCAQRAGTKGRITVTLN